MKCLCGCGSRARLRNDQGEPQCQRRRRAERVANVWAANLPRSDGGGLAPGQPSLLKRRRVCS